jgi:hypothetical protein
VLSVQRKIRKKHRELMQDHMQEMRAAMGQMDQMMGGRQQMMKQMGSGMMMGRRPGDVPRDDAAAHGHGAATHGYDADDDGPDDGTTAAVRTHAAPLTEVVAVRAV